MIIPPSWTVPEAIRTRMGQGSYGRQRAIVEAGHVLLVLHKPPGPDDRSREGVLFWRNPEGEWRHNHGGPGPVSLKRHVETYSAREATLTAEYERAADIGSLFDLLESLTPLSRAASNLHQALQAAREAVRVDPFLIEMRNLAYELDRNLELLGQDVRNAIQHRTARKAEEQAQLSEQALHASHRLNILAALFFPLTAIASLFGMNLVHGLESQLPIAFWLVFVAGGGLGWGMKVWVLSRRPSDRPPRRT